MKKIGIMLICASLVALSTSISAAHMMGRGMGPGMMNYDETREGMHHRGGWGMRGMHEMGIYGGCFSFIDILDELDLKESQLKKLKTMKNSFRKEHIILKADLKVAKMEFAELLSEETPNMNKIEKKIDKIVKIQAKLLMIAAKASSESRPLLTEEQRQKVREIIRERRSDCRMFNGQRKMR